MRHTRLIYVFALGLLLILVQKGHAKVEVRHEGKSIHYSISIEGLDIQEKERGGERFSEVKFKGIEDRYQAIQYEVGRPKIPVIRFYVDGNPTVTERPLASKVVSEAVLSTRLIPSLKPVSRSSSDREVLVLDEKAYAEDIFQPEKRFSVEKVGSIGGVPRHLVTVYPFHYSASRSQYRLESRFELSVSLDQSPLESKAASPGYVFVVGKKFEQSPAVNAYSEFKKSLGFSTKIMIVTADEAPLSIRNRLRDLYQSSPFTHILIIGDQADVPGYASSLLVGSTDHYYRCLDTENYETDIGTPDVEVGRISVRDEAELSRVFLKQVKYERGTFQDKHWLSAVSFIATDDSYPEHWQMVENTHTFNIDTHMKPQNFLGFFPTAQLSGGDKLYAITHKASTKDVLDQVQMGRLWIDYGGHGGATGWSGPALSIEDVETLSNPDANPFVSSQACYTAHFVEESFGEAWLRSSSGSILFWGSMDVLFWDPADDRIDRASYEAIFRDHKTEIGSFVHYAISEGWRLLGGEGKSKYYWETYVLLGDPGIHLKTPFNP